MSKRYILGHPRVHLPNCVLDANYKQCAVHVRGALRPGAPARGPEAPRSQAQRTGESGEGGCAVKVNGKRELVFSFRRLGRLTHNYTCQLTANQFSF